MALANLFSRFDAFITEARWHPDVSDQNLGLSLPATIDNLVIVGSHPDHFQVRAAVDERTYSLADDQVVVGEKNADVVPCGPY
jgi:hypothetical protein